MEQLEDIPAGGRYSPRGKFDVRFIKALLKEVVEGLPIRAAAARYGVNRKLIYRWIKQYGAEGRPIGRRDLPIKDKRTIVRAILCKKMTIDAASKAYQVSIGAIRCWMKLHAVENEELSFFNQQQLGKEKTKQQAGTDSEEVRQLQQQLADAQLRIAALNTLIDVAEEQLKINIRKKPGARQS